MEGTQLGEGSTFGRYSIVRKIGEGGMGAVFEARHLDLDKRVALKTLSTALSLRGEAQARFLREARVAARLDHPHAVAVADVGACDGMPYMVMEYLEGEDLQALLNREHKLSAQRVAELIVPVVSALAAAHAVGIVHRDVKPHNVFLVRTRLGGVHPKLLDFGISKIVDGVAGGDLTQTASMLGTPYYMSPEQVQSSKYADAKSDQYSLGVMLYQLASGALPYESNELYPLLNAIATGQHMHLQARDPDLPPMFCAMVERAISVSRDERFPNLLELGRTLLGFASPAFQTRWQGALNDTPEAPPTGLTPSPHDKPLERSVAATSNSVVLPRKPSAPWTSIIVSSAIAMSVTVALTTFFFKTRNDDAVAAASAHPSPPAPAASLAPQQVAAAEAPPVASRAEPTAAPPPAPIAPPAEAEAKPARVAARPATRTPGPSTPPRATDKPSTSSTNSQRDAPANTAPSRRTSNNAPIIE
jgi:serine/threonine-protein kinase